MVRYVTIRKFSEESGYTEKAIYNKVNDGTWLENMVWKRAPDGRVLIDKEGYERWARGEFSSQPLAGKQGRSLPMESPAPLTDRRVESTRIRSPKPIAKKRAT
jgi:hypothetical protein